MLSRVQESFGSFVRFRLVPLALPIVEGNYIPDILLRLGMRAELAMEREKLEKLSNAERARKEIDFIKELKTMPICIAQEKANEQHYEVPAEFYKVCLGPCLKYSSGYWPQTNTTLAESEVAMLELYCERSGIKDGMNIIDLGCGWGSVSLYMAKKYPNCTVTGISNSNSQREAIMQMARERGLNNVRILTGDINSFDLPSVEHGSYDLVISIEMFEHMKNYELLMGKVASWLKQNGKLFVHIFTHRLAPGHYSSGFLTEQFFTGGTLPSENTLLYFQKDLRIVDRWRIKGTHYARTLEAWCVQMDNCYKRGELQDILARTYGQENVVKWYVYWRLFYLGCAEAFASNGGEDYPVSHYLFEKN